MTPQEKAKELVSKFHPIVRWKLGQESVGSRAKECALIVVDERIDEMYDWMGGGNYEWEKNRFQYWEQVKQQIEKL